MLDHYECDFTIAIYIKAAIIIGDKIQWIGHTLYSKILLYSVGLWLAPTNGHVSDITYYYCLKFQRFQFTKTSTHKNNSDLTATL